MDQATTTSPNSSTSVGFCSACHRSNFACIYSQLSGDVFVALPTLTAISGLNDALQLINADKVFRVTPKRFAASVTVKPRALITSSRKISPGWLGFLWPIILNPPLNLVIISIINRDRISTVKPKNDSPITANTNGSTAFFYPRELMQFITGQIHVSWSYRCIQTIQDSGKLGYVLWVNTTSIIIMEKLFQSSVFERLNHTILQILLEHLATSLSHQIITQSLAQFQNPASPVKSAYQQSALRTRTRMKTEWQARMIVNSSNLKT